MPHPVYPLRAMPPFVEFSLAAIPLALLVLLMLVARWSAAKAGATALAAALVLGWAYFGFGETSRLQATLGSLLEALFTTAFILWIIFAALCVYYLQLATGATETLKDAAFRLARSPVTLIIIVAWFFPLFMEGAAGFGTPIALAAPLLVSLGVSPVNAVAIGLIGHAAGVSFGAVGTPVFVQSVITGFDAAELARNIAPYQAAAGWVLLGATVYLGVRAMPGRPAIGLSGVGWTLTAGALFLGPYVAIAMILGPELPTLGAAAIGGLSFAFLLVIARRRRAPEPMDDRDSGSSRRSILWASAPYLALVALVLITRLVPGVREALQAVTLEWTLPGGFSGTAQPLYHPGTILFLIFVIGGVFQRAGWQRQRQAAGAALRRLGAVSVALVVMLTLSRLLLHAGMIDTMASASADVVGNVWPALAPGLAALGSFVTGSATASNVLFTDFQLQVARLLGAQELAVMGAQGFGGAMGNIVSPHNIIAGSATVGIVGQESAVLRKIMPVFLACLLVGGVLALAWSST
ncbi:MAG: L-lactate permease [Dehalococcoidia bacterium]